MKCLKTGLFIIVMNLLTIFVNADTFHLSTGVTFDGQIISESQDGILTIKVGSQTLKYRKSEIVKIEKNEKKGGIDLHQIKKEWENHDKELTERTGLNKDQRAQVQAFLSILEWGEEFQKSTAKNSLFELQKKVNIFPYLEYTFSSLSPIAGSHIFEIMFKIDRTRTLPILHRELTNPAPQIRKKAIELLALSKDTESYKDLVRGLVDPELDVCISTIYAVSIIGFKEATPILIEYLNHPQLEIQNVSREALNKIWKEELQNMPLQTQAEWQKFWEDKSHLYPNSLKKENHTPLIDKEFKFFIG